MEEKIKQLQIQLKIYNQIKNNQQKVIEENNIYQESIEYESDIDIIIELIKRNENILQLIEEIKEIEQEMLKDKIKLSKKKNELIENIKKLNEKNKKEKIKENKEIKENIENIEKIEKEYKIEEEYWKNEKINLYSIEKELKMKENMKEIIKIKQEKEIEDNIYKITEMEIKNILFNSNIDKWSQNDSNFGKKLEGKQNIIIVIEDKEGNIFGGFISKEIIQNKFIFDNNSYLFSLKKDGKIINKKYPIKNNEYCFKISSDEWRVLFGFGAKDNGDMTSYKDICVYKKDYKNGKNSCEQHSYEYKGEENALIGKKEFEVNKTESPTFYL